MVINSEKREKVRTYTTGLFWILKQAKKSTKDEFIQGKEYIRKIEQYVQLSMEIEQLEKEKSKIKEKKK